MSKSSDYWKNRLDEVAQKRFDLTQQELERKLRKLYKGASKRIELKVEQLYYKLLEEGKLSTTELYSYKRYIDLQEEINKELVNVGAQEVKLMNPSLTQAFEEVFEGTMKAMGSKAISFSTINPLIVEQLVNTNWSGEHYSSRIWANKDKVARILKDGIEECITSGTSKDKLVEKVKVAFGKGFDDADRIVRSELMHIINEGQRQVYKDEGYDELEYLVALDERTCKKCGPKDGKKIPISSNEIPPIHARCRCTIIPVLKGFEDSKGERTAKDPITGERYKIPGNRTYDEWWEKDVIGKHGKDNVALHMKKLKNQTSDIKQHKKYRELLGDEVPKSFDKFQEVKYTDSKKWNNIKESIVNKPIRDKISSNSTIKTIEIGKQGKHLKNHKNYIEGRSYVIKDEKTLQEIINQKASTGIIKRDSSGRWNNKETITADTMIGVNVNKNHGHKTLTDKATIHYSQKGTHIVPTVNKLRGKNIDELKQTAKKMAMEYYDTPEYLKIVNRTKLTNAEKEKMVDLLLQGKQSKTNLIKDIKSMEKKILKSRGDIN